MAEVACWRPGLEHCRRHVLPGPHPLLEGRGHWPRSAGRRAAEGEGAWRPRRHGMGNAAPGSEARPPSPARGRAPGACVRGSPGGTGAPGRAAGPRPASDEVKRGSKAIGLPATEQPPPAFPRLWVIFCVQERERARRGQRTTFKADKPGRGGRGEREGLRGDRVQFGFQPWL